jgi:bifunctional non-homologous end joining protein LigD
MRPMLASATPKVRTGDPAVTATPDGPEWLHEVKWDGMRVLADVRDGRVRLSARSEADVTVTFPELAGLAEVLPDALFDGEVVAMASGRPSFQALAERMHVQDRRRAQRLATTQPVVLMIFDVLRLYGVDLLDRPLQDRRATLERLELDAAHWQVPPAYDDGRALLAATREQGLEGVVSKRRTSIYEPGKRSKDWVKVANRRVQSCLVGGWRPEVGSDHRLAALLVGVPHSGSGRTLDRLGLDYVGRVGSGISGRSAAALTELLRPLARPTAPFVGDLPRDDAVGSHWTEPQVVVEVEYLGRTEANRLRAPTYRGLRRDLGPADVRWE